MYWYEEEVQRLERERQALKYTPRTLFYGSSSIRLWSDLYQQFKELVPVNLGFGGSTMAACVWFFDRIVPAFKPELIVIYAGDNDLGDGRHPEEVFIFFQHLMTKIRKRFGNIPVFFISIKPSICRRNILDRIRFTNQIINEELSKDPDACFIDVYHQMLDKYGHPVGAFFEEDGLHLNEKGYELWKAVISLHIKSFFKQM
ncbi:SGNH/GDSL hydrolase family protein [Desertivirga xinjiangensis]|uniref:SGNH/GDSL hydrolase family protein n=1 Tax=Desertivirga xinjiangensis TaxID=539206 RepID=UPI00210E6ADD|nr:SGNH/GDSL hydrolase family protein [Pedobacter xinjiangensis]